MISRGTGIIKLLPRWKLLNSHINCDPVDIWDTAKHQK